MTVFNKPHLSKAEVPMVFTPSGMVTSVIDDALKALFAMAVTDAGIMVVLHPTISSLSLVLIIALQLSRESKVVFPSATTIDSMLEQPWKAQSPIVVSVVGKETVFKEAQ